MIVGRKCLLGFTDFNMIGSFDWWPDLRKVYELSWVFQIQKGTELRQNLIDEVLSNVALTSKAKTEMSKRYAEYLDQARVLLFYQYRVRQL